MRQLGSALIILLLITAYGRCVADQMGMLHTTAAPCCQVVCNQTDHCTPEADQTNDSTADHDHDHNHDHGDAPCDSDSPEQDKDHQQTPEDQPSPCQLCFILDSDSIIQGELLKVPSPLLFELSSVFYISPLDSLLELGHPVTTLDQPPTDYPETLAGQRSLMRSIVAKSTPVRGPSIV